MKGSIPAPVMPLVTPEPRAHTVPCKHCPSAHFPPDPECEEQMQWPHAARVDAAFACGWNKKRYCKGFCDVMGITNEDLKARHERGEHT